MAVKLNTFAALLLAFPLYLAIRGKLAQYIALAKPGNTGGAGVGSTPQANPNPVSSAGSAPSSAMDFLRSDGGTNLSAVNPIDVATVFDDAVGLFG